MTITAPHTTEFLNGLTAVHLHALKDKSSHVLTCVQVDELGIRACDRYTCGIFDLELVNTDPGTSLLIPREACEWLIKQKAPIYHGGRIEFDESKITVFNEFDAVIAATAFIPIEGNYPPLEKLYKTESAETVLPINLSSKNLTKFTTAATRCGKTEEDQRLRLEFTATANPKKPGAVHVSIGCIPSFRGLLQPRYEIK